jgi:hypothetical protein
MQLMGDCGSTLLAEWLNYLAERSFSVIYFQMSN